MWFLEDLWGLYIHTYEFVLRITKKVAVLFGVAPKITSSTLKKRGIIYWVVVTSLRVVTVPAIPFYLVAALYFRMRRFSFSSMRKRSLSVRTQFVGYQRSLVMMPPIDWDFRHQRPQQIAVELVKTGRKVLYLNPSIQHSLGLLPELKIEMSNGVYVGTFCSRIPSRYIGIDAITEAEANLLVPLIEHHLDRNIFDSAVLIIQQPSWFHIAERLANNRIIFDCMDDHLGFDNIPDSFLALEKSTLRLSDALVVSSDVLASNMHYDSTRQSVVIRNGVAFEDFYRELYDKPTGSLVIGYFGAIAEWFDIELVSAIAQAFPDAQIQLIGKVSHQRVQEILSQHRNITFFGEVPYANLPLMLASWNVALIPFLVNRLTLATNPVKLYEYSAAGIPTVATRLPEVTAVSKQVQGVFVADSHKSFIESIHNAAELPTVTLTKLQDWAREQSWQARVEKILPLLNDEILVSIIILMWNHASKTIACLNSVLNRNDYENIEILLVDNGSELDQSSLVKRWSEERGRGIVKFIRNESNLGFAAGNNVGMSVAQGQFIVLLNNDTEVTPGWIHRALRHFRENPNMGILGPSTDNCGNEAMVRLRGPQSDWLEEVIPRFGFKKSRVLPARVVAFFCVFIKREVVAEIGNLDEAFGRGYFEDDDYCKRVEGAGYQVGIARDIFVHHDMGASFGKIPSPEKQALFDQNKALFESKWGTWVPHTYAIDEDQW